MRKGVVSDTRDDSGVSGWAARVKGKSEGPLEIIPPTNEECGREKRNKQTTEHNYFVLVHKAMISDMHSDA